MGGRPSMYLEELFHWLMTVVDSLPLEEKYKDEAFKSAVDHVAECLLVNSSLLPRDTKQAREPE